MKPILTIMLLVCLSVTIHAQTLQLRMGHSFIPASHLSLRYEHWTNSAINLSLGGFMERSRKNNLNYSVYGAELLAEFASNREGLSAGAFGWRAGLGGVWQIENDPFVYKDWPFKRRMNYGLAGELSGEWFMTENFTLRASLQQKILFNKELGRYRFMLGLGLAYCLNAL